MRKVVQFAAVATTALVAVAAVAQTTRQPGGVPLIERAKLFGNPTRTGGQLSPDGKWLGFIAPRDGVLNVWVAPVDRPNDARPLTAEKVRPIRAYFWAPDSKQILFVNDKGGDENFLLYGVDLASGAQKALTPFEKTTVQVVGMSDSIKDRILIGVNNRDPRWHDVQELSLATGRLTPVFRNDGYAGFLSDDQLRLRIAVKPRPDSGVDYYRVIDNKVEATPFTRVDYEDASSTAPLGFTTDGRTLYWGDARGRDTRALLAQDMATGKFTTIGANDRADVGGGLTNPRTGVVEAYSVNFHRNEYVPVGNAVKRDLAFLKAQNKGEFQIGSRTDADDKWLVTFDPVTAPSSTWLYDRRAGKLTELYTPRSELVGAPLVAMEAVDIPTRDGLSMVSYLTRPKGASAATPMVLLVHGGPWARDTYGFNGYHQWLANRGYAVLSVNFRSSTGFGKKFVQAGDRQWGRKMHDDLIDAVDWAVKRGVTTREKVAIMGGSYGGYATLAGLTMTPDAFACGVDIVGPSNLFTLLKTIPPYWEAGKQQMYRRMGDPGTPEGQALLKERSPLTYADQIRKPLLIGQGANDPRVNVAESDQIVAAMKARDIPVTYVVFPDEGHGFARPANNIAFNAVAENFLAKCLGGRAEPIGGALAASTAQVRAGAVEGGATAAGGTKGN
ncbi:MAG: S9 family peptidase [Sphingomonas hengshuiensis]|uniref:S9 family peptidase n=1 Tax=Sphingomonas hengshuiensis TaxID=1609977 RepID=A0A2W4Z6A9_9SPHN|nr:MAG: S9 family peptidase [Sphingomonas hengshuiensis]